MVSAAVKPESGEKTSTPRKTPTEKVILYKSTVFIIICKSLKIMVELHIVQDEAEIKMISTFY